MDGLGNYGMIQSKLDSKSYHLECRYADPGQPRFQVLYERDWVLFDLFNKKYAFDIDLNLNLNLDILSSSSHIFTTILQLIIYFFSGAGA